MDIKNIKNEILNKYSRAIVTGGAGCKGCHIVEEVFNGITGNYKRLLQNAYLGECLD